MPWSAHLDLSFAPRAGVTRLIHRRHEGPLQVQKALYPEGPQICHVTILHPPGGIAAQDRLSVHGAVSGDAHVVLTTPGATKWYRSTGQRAEQSLKFELADRAVLEWLPRETILFDAAAASLQLELRLAARARFLGWEILCFGRRASGEQWRSGSVRLDTRILRDGRPLWSERGELDASSGFAASPVGLAGFSVSATLLAAGFEADPELLQACRAIAPPTGDARHGLTWTPGMLVCRYLGDSSEQAFLWFAALWTLLRPALLGRVATAPRLWAC